MLLERQTSPALDAVERLAGLQAQVPSPPYVGLWTRLGDFRREELTRLMEERQVVRATLMRATLHLVTAEDYLLLRPALQPALTRSMNSIAGKRLEGLDLDRLVEAAREYFEREPRPFADFRPLLSELEPKRDPSALAYAVRTELPLVQVPTGGVWGYAGKVPFTTAEKWLGRSLSSSEDPRGLVLRYLAAFGPATVRDVQTWSGRTQLKQSVEEIKAGLRIFSDERGNELLDLPDAPLPSGDTPAPLRPRLPQPGALPRRQGMCDLRRAPQEGLPLGGQGHVPNRRFRAGALKVEESGDARYRTLRAPVQG